MRFPEKILSYFGQNAIVGSSVYYLTTTTAGNVINVGNFDDILIRKPAAGYSIDETIPSLHGIFPVRNDLYLPNIELLPSRTFNVHVVQNGKEIWVLAEETSNKLEQHYKPFQSEHLIQSFLKKLDYLILKQEGGPRFSIQAEMPKWATSIGYHIEKLFDISEVFPFLENFLEHLPLNSEAKHYSGLWVDALPDGNQINLQAWAIYKEGDWYLFVQPVVESLLFDQQQIIQSARENSLAYEQLTKTKRELQKLVELKEQFIKTVSHDYRSPISTMIEAITMLHDDFKNKEVIEEIDIFIIEKVMQELTRLLEYNNKLYNWTQLNLESIEINKQPVSISELVDISVLQFKSRLEEKNINLKIENVEDVVIITDYVLFAQVLVNLIDNAIKYSEANTQIIISASSKHLTISDKGVGMDEETREKIVLGISQKSKWGTNGERGTGLGMSIVFSILETLGYSFEIKSKPAQGTSITIKFEN